MLAYKQPSSKSQSPGGRKHSHVKGDHHINMMLLRRNAFVLQVQYQWVRKLQPVLIGTNEISITIRDPNLED